MKIAFVADCHVGNHKRFGGVYDCGINVRGRLTLQALEYAVDQAVNQACTALIIAGDLSDTDHPSPQLLAEMQRILARIKIVLILLGNHDATSSLKGDHALGPLGPLCKILEVPEYVVLEDCAERVHLLLVPFQNNIGNEYIPAAIAQLMPKRRKPGRYAVAFHAGIRDPEVPRWLSESADAIDVEVIDRALFAHDIDAAFAGNWHDKKQWVGMKDRPIVQIGTTAPTGFDNPGFEHFGSMAIWDTQTNAVQSIEVPGPRFLKASALEELKQLNRQIRKRGQVQLEGYALFLEATVLQPDFAAAREIVEKLERQNFIVASQVLVSKEAERIAAMHAAEVARNTDTVAAAVEEYVARLELPNTVTPEAVIARVRKYLAL